MRYKVGDLVLTVDCYNRTPKVFLITGVCSSDMFIEHTLYKCHILEKANQPIIGGALEHAGQVTVIKSLDRRIDFQSSWQTEQIIPAGNEGRSNYIETGRIYR